MILTQPKKILLSFDIEEFDLPLEYGKKILPEQQLTIGNDGLNAIVPLLAKHQISCTHFTTAHFANNFKDSIKELSATHEIASHAYYHSQFSNQDLLLSKLALEKIIGKPVVGLRMPRLKKIDPQIIIDAGYLYDSSVNPTYLPGRYNNLNLPRNIYNNKGILEIPASVAYPLRIPLFWLSFKNLPYNIYKLLALSALKKDGYLCLYFHPWEFTNITQWGLPKIITKNCGHSMLLKLNRLIIDLKKHADFVTLKEFAQSKKTLSGE